MSLPRVLVVDDQYARDPTEWVLFLRRSGVIEVGDKSVPVNDFHGKWGAAAAVRLCSGQRQASGRIENDYAVIEVAVRGAGTRGEGWALILLDATFDSGMLQNGIPKGQGGDSEFGEQIRNRLAVDFPDLPVVMLTSKRQQELVDSSSPYLSKQGLDQKAIRETLLRYGRLDPMECREVLKLDNDVIGEASQTLVAFREAFVHASRGNPILILGESGTGKEVLARYIHRLSGRKGSFIAVNIAALPRDLVESELFGVERGVATGVGERPGKLELAHGGTLFLDEIGDMPLEAQVKILRALQEREVFRIGGRRPIGLDIDLVCATSRDLPAMISDGTFREDLYYRINTVPISMPPLRQRREDIKSLAQYFLAQAVSASGRVGIQLTPEAIDAMQSHSFPGNVRELENLIKRLASAAGNNEVIGALAVARALADSVASRSGDDPVEEPVGLVKHDAVSLASLPNLLAEIPIDSSDSALSGIKVQLDRAYRALLQRLAGAAVERCRDPVTGTLNRQRAMQLLTGDSALKGKKPARVVNEILGRRQDDRVTDEDLENLIRLWREGKT